MSKLLHLEDLAALEQAFAKSGQYPVLIFKHSAT